MNYLQRFCVGIKVWAYAHVCVCVSVMHKNINCYDTIVRWTWEKNNRPIFSDIIWNILDGVLSYVVMKTIMNFTTIHFIHSHLVICFIFLFGKRSKILRVSENDFPYTILFKFQIKIKQMRKEEKKRRTLNESLDFFSLVRFLNINAHKTFSAGLLYLKPAEWRSIEKKPGILK